MGLIDDIKDNIFGSVKYSKRVSYFVTNEEIGKSLRLKGKVISIKSSGQNKQEIVVEE